MKRPSPSPSPASSSPSGPGPQDAQREGLPPGLSFWHPASLIATWFGTGLLPKAPGSWGSLAALPVAWVLVDRLGSLALIAAALLLFVLGLWATHVFLRHSRSKDPQAVVIDEVSGQMLALVPAGLDPLGFLLGFVFFRIFDIMKPWPIKTMESGFPGAFGVMIDDTAAALYASACLAVYYLLLGQPVAFL